MAILGELPCVRNDVVPSVSAMSRTVAVVIFSEFQLLGAAGQLLSKIIAACGLREDEVYICRCVEASPGAAPVYPAKEPQS